MGAKLSEQDVLGKSSNSVGGMLHESKGSIKQSFTFAINGSASIQLCFFNAGVMPIRLQLHYKAGKQKIYKWILLLAT
jgi:hypothetical protein